VQPCALEGDSRAAGYEEMLRGLGFDPTQGLEPALRACAATGAACLLY
jgi:hypothetical protein